jgi:hypothetical protein
VVSFAEEATMLGSNATLPETTAELNYRYLIEFVVFYFKTTEYFGKNLQRFAYQNILSLEGHGK